MNKTALFFIQSSVILISSCCLMNVFEHLTQPALVTPDPLPSDFDLWKEGSTQGIHIDAGKEVLSNYHEEFHIEFSGRDEAGAEVTLFHEYALDVNNLLDARYETETIQSPNTFLNGTHETVVLDRTSYSLQNSTIGGLTCTIVNLSPDMKVTYHIDMLQNIEPGKLLEKNVQVNGVLADQYEIVNVRIWLSNKIKTVTGKVWIAQETPYLLKAEGTLGGDFEFEGSTFSGRADFLYEVKENDSAKIQVPALCANPIAERIPRPANAYEVQESTYMMTFSIADSLDQTKDFYLKALTDQGWQVTVVEEDEFSQVLQVSKASADGLQIALDLTIRQMSEGSYVVISWFVQ